MNDKRSVIRVIAAGFSPNFPEVIIGEQEDGHYSSRESQLESEKVFVLSPHRKRFSR